MQLWRDLPSFAGTPAAGAVTAIGGFDGVHRGHQALLAEVKRQAEALSVPSMVISFEPSPRQFFLGPTARVRLQRFRERFASLAACGLDHFVCLRFDQRLRALTPTQFAMQVLHEALQLRAVVVGHDFKFGQNGAGDVMQLREFGQQLGFAVTEFAPWCVDADRVSSTLVREALLKGDMARAACLLGVAYSIEGHVVHGQQLGRTLGYPTANLRLNKRVIPQHGVYAVRVSGGGLQRAAAVASLGTRPVVQGVEPLLEVHVFDFNGDLYRQRLKVEFVARLRDELMFPSLDALVEQIHRDAAQARQLLAANA